ncbi:MAG: TolC family protein, partial [Planctomycetales bacterium]
RWRGFGAHLSDANGPGGFDNALQNMTEGDFQEWQLGLTLNVPIGFREGKTAVRNAQLSLVREKAVLQEQELQVAHDLGGAIREVHRSYQLTQTNHNRRLAAQWALAAGKERFQTRTRPEEFDVNNLLEAQRRLAEAESSYFRSVVEFNLAVKAVHFEKGSLLEYNNVRLSEGPWPRKAYNDALKRARRRAVAKRIDYGFTLPEVVSRGRYRHNTGQSTAPVVVESEFQKSPSREPQPIEDVPARPESEEPEERELPPIARREQPTRKAQPANIAKTKYDWGEMGKPKLQFPPIPPGPADDEVVEAKAELVLEIPNSDRFEDSAVQPAVHQVVVENTARKNVAATPSHQPNRTRPSASDEPFKPEPVKPEPVQTQAIRIRTEPIPSNPIESKSAAPMQQTEAGWSGVRRRSFKHIDQDRKRESHGITSQPPRETHQPATGWQSTKR